MKPIFSQQASISHFMTYGGTESIKMIQKNNILTCIIFISVGRGGGGQDKRAWTACPPGGEDNKGGGQDTLGQFAPLGQANGGWLVPWGQAVQGGKLGHRPILP